MRRPGIEKATISRHPEVWRSFRFAPCKRALHVAHGLASHWSCAHTGYWSAARYGFMPLQRKNKMSWIRTPKLGQGRGLIQREASQEPVTAAGLARRREKKVKDAAASGRPEPRPAEMDLYDVIVKNGFRNTPEKALSRLIAFLKGHGAPTLVAFAFWMLEQVGGFLWNSWQVWRGPTLQQHVLAFVRVCGCRQTAKLDLEWAWTASTKMLLRDGVRAGIPVVVLNGRFGGEWVLSTRTLGMFMALQAPRSVGPFLSLALTARK